MQLGTGLLRLEDIIGASELTAEQADKNREYNKQAAAEAVKNGRVDAYGKPIYKRRPTRPRPAKPAIISIQKSTWWAGIKDHRFPAPVKIGCGRATFWRAEDIRALIKGRAA